MKSSSDLIAVENKHLVLYAWEMNLKLTATAAIGVVILSMASNPSLERRSFVWPGSGSTIGNLYVPNQRMHQCQSFVQKEKTNQVKKLVTAKAMTEMSA